MKITCLGAAGCVTGSCFLLDNGKQYLVDCGLFQGGKHMEAMNRQQWGFKPGDLSALLLTHAHIDHCGRIPKLVKDGFKARIYATAPTVELCKILLLDSAHIQEMEAEWQTRKNRRGGNRDVEPLYTVQDAEHCFPLFSVVEENETLELDPHFRMCFRNAGHILGSSILEVWSGPPSNTHKVVFSGDLGYKGQLILQDPYAPTTADVLLIESTYGNRNHKSFEESEKELVQAIHYSYQHKEKVMIPAFAVERTQELLYMIGRFVRQGIIPSMPVYLDSPLAIAATDIFRRMTDFYDEDALALVNDGQDPFAFQQLILSRSSQESIAINQTSGPAIIIAGNGMCTAGRIKHHLKHNLWRRGSSLVIVGFQAAGTLGRLIVEGAQRVRIFGEEIVVRSKVFTIGGFSAHADQAYLLEWIGHFENRFMHVYAVHGERSVSDAFAALVEERFGFPARVPVIGDTITPVRLKPESIPEGIEEASWQRHLMKVIRKGEQIRKLWEESPGVLSDRLLQQFEVELLHTESSLDKILGEAAANTRKD
jgi:metallo-beta-lactamase family protein